MANKKSAIPSPRAAGALSVTDGCDFIGCIVHHDGVWFGSDDVLLGEFDSQHKAVCAFRKPMLTKFATTTRSIKVSKQ